MMKNCQVNILVVENEKIIAEALKIKKLSFGQLYENIPIGLYYATSDGHFIKVNQTLTNMMGFKRKEELLKQTMEIRYINSEYQNQWLNAIKSKKTLKHTEMQWRRKDGSYIWVLESVRPLHDNQGDIICFEGAVQNITTQKETELQLRVIKKSLEDYITEMKEYARIASYDLQEPIQQISGYAQLLERQLYKQLSPEANEFIANIINGTERMQDLIQDFIDYTNVLTRTPKKEKISAEAIIENVIAHLHPEMLSLNANVQYNPLPDIFADPTMVQLLFRHLIDNALKYKSDTAPFIIISAESYPDQYQFNVKDNGIGITEAYQNQIFKLFKRMHSKSNYPGTGMGLAICKQIIKKHDGQIWVQSNEGKGASFSFTMKRGAS